MHFSEHPISFFVCVPSFFAWQSCYRTWSVKRKRCKSPNFKSAPSPAPTGRTTFFPPFFSFLFGRLRQREPQSGRWEAPKRIRPIKEQQITCASFSSFFLSLFHRCRHQSCSSSPYSPASSRLSIDDRWLNIHCVITLFFFCLFQKVTWVVNEIITC